jgi:hypothetical protein
MVEPDCPGFGRSTSEAAVAEVKKQIARRNEEAQKAGRKKRTAREKEQLANLRKVDAALSCGRARGGGVRCRIRVRAERLIHCCTVQVNVAHGPFEWVARFARGLPQAPRGDHRGWLALAPRPRS